MASDFSEGLSKGVESLGQDRISGATDLSARAADILLDYIALARAWPPARQREGLIALCEQLLQAQPNMAPIVNLCSAALEAGARNRRDSEEWARQVEETVRSFRDQLESCNRAIAAQSLPILQGFTKPVRVATLSASSSVMAVLLHAAHAGVALKVFCAESRPHFEGRDFAERLAAEGVPVTLFIDAALPLAVHNADVALVGADAIGIGGVVNKMGTQALVLAARQAGVPAYVLCGTLKFWPAAAGPGPRLDEYDIHDPGEVYQGLAPVRVLNRYFESVPLTAFAGVVTENGPMDRKTVLRHLRRMPYFDVSRLRA